MKDLLLQPEVTTAIATTYEFYERISLQLQRDVSAKGNDDETIQVIKGLQRLDDVLLLFREEGKADIQAEKESTNTRP